MSPEDILQAAIATKQLEDAVIIQTGPVTEAERVWHDSEMIKLYGKDWKKNEDDD